MSRSVPIVGGVLDGDRVSVPKGAEAGYTAVLNNSIQTTEYELRDGHDDSQAMVAKGMKWPLLEAAGA